MNRTKACCALLLLVPAPVVAQAFSVGPYAATDRGLPGSPVLAGLAATVWSGPLGVRLSGAMDLPSTPVAPLFGQSAPDAVGAWSGDLDMVLSGGRAGVRVGGIEPGAFVGFGVHGQRDAAGSTATIPVWSYGLTAGLPVARWLELAAEARYRMPHESDPADLPPGVAGGLELRAGMFVHLGGGGRRPAAPAAPATIHLGRGGSAMGDPAPAPPRTVSGDDRAVRTLDTADDYLGVRYRWGGDSPAEGFDCSGFVQYVFARNGIRLPRVSRDQALAGSPLPARVSALRPGDLLFFAERGSEVSHVAIYAGDGTILHASESSGGVRYDRLGSRRGRWYATHFVAARRVIH